MRLERASAYGLLALIFLANWSQGGPAQVQQIAEGTGVPVEYLRKLLGRLSRARLIRSIRGRHGGFRLAQPLNRITMLRVVEAIEGPIDSTAFFEDDLIKPSNGLAPHLQRWRKKTATQLRDLLSETTLSDILAA
ncbi:MAG: Rrf2 family transcriptional regulator [Phycisphaeraceae bacterium]